jgi:5-methylthioadenosine/S-adenosylhomocysteine deaminase
MRFALGIHRAVAKDASVITAKEVLEMATIGGARALGLEDAIGTLEPGKRADMVAVHLGDSSRKEEIHLSILAKSSSDVAVTVVDGVEVFKRD